MIYFDNAATTYPKAPIVEKELRNALSSYSYSAGRSMYVESENGAKIIDDTRRKIVSFLNSTSISSDNVVFTSTITEAINNILYGLELEEGDDVYVSPFEHNAVLRTLNALKVNIHILPFSKNDYEPDYDHIKTLFAIHRPCVVILSQISNVTGFELPYSKIFELSHRYKAVSILDAAQGFGIHNIDINNIDIIAFEGHKSLYSIYGTAGFINLNDVILKCIKVGGTGSDSLNLEMPDNLPYRYEAGSYNTFSIYILNKAIDFVKNTPISRINDENTLYLVEKLKRFNNVHIYAPKDYIPKGIISFNIDGKNPSDVGKLLYENGKIAVRTGFHCAAFVHKFLETENIGGTARVSLGAFNTKQEIDTFIDVLKEI